MQVLSLVDLNLLNFKYLFEQSLLSILFVIDLLEDVFQGLFLYCINLLERVLHRLFSSNQLLVPRRFQFFFLGPSDCLNFPQVLRLVEIKVILLSLHSPLPVEYWVIVLILFVVVADHFE